MRTAVAVVVLLVGASCTRSPQAAVEQSPEALPETPGSEGTLSPANPVTTHAAAPSPIKVTAEAAVSPADISSVSDVRFVTVDVQVIAPGAGNTLAVEFVAPGQRAYERRDFPLTGSDAPQLLTMTLPVAGTAIDLHQMVGTWNARVYVNGLPQASASFELTP